MSVETRTTWSVVVTDSDADEATFEPNEYACGDPGRAFKLSGGDALCVHLSREDAQKFATAILDALTFHTAAAE